MEGHRKHKTGGGHRKIKRGGGGGGSQTTPSREGERWEAAGGARGSHFPPQGDCQAAKQVPGGGSSEQGLKNRICQTKTNSSVAGHREHFC